MRSLRPTRIDVLVCYDVNTTTSVGEARLRKVAKACEGFGQRVQYSVFECSLTEQALEEMRQKLLDIMELKEDSLRIYRFSSGRLVETYGIDRYIDFSSFLMG